MGSHGARWRHRSRSAPVALVAVVCSLGLGIGTLHEVLVAHARCPEHGEVVHAATAEAASAAPERVGTHRVAPYPAHGSTNDHEHCALAQLKSDSDPLRPCAAGVPPPQAPPSGPVAAFAWTPSRLAILLAAPKASPPA